MTLPVSFRRAARVEFDEAFDWYEQQRPGLGVEFADEVDATIRQIADHPERRALVYKDVRRAVVRKFPYSIFYRVKPDRVAVVAVFHDKRNPSAWKSRK